MNRKRKCFKTVAAALVTISVLLGCSAEEMTQMPEEASSTENTIIPADSTEEGFATPEEAVIAYLTGLKNNNFGCMADTFGEGNGAEDISRQYAYLCGIDLIPEMADSSVVMISGSEEAEKLLNQIVQQMEAVDFSSMEFLGFVYPDDLTDTYSTDTYQENLSVIAQNYGGSDFANRVAAIQIDGRQYMLFFDIIKRDDRWYNFQLGGFLANMVGLERESAGTVRLDTDDEKILKTLLSGAPEKLPEAGKDVQAVQPRVEAEGFDSPQQAAAGYLEGLKEQDMEQMLSTFAVESYAENYNLQAYLEYMQSYFFMQQDVNLPPVNAFVKAMISYERMEHLKKDIHEQGRALYVCTSYFDNSQITQEDVSFEWEELPEKINLDSIEILGFISPETLSEYYGTEQMLKIQNRHAQICGADQIKDCVVVFSCDEGTYCLFMESVEYNGKWYNSQFGNTTSLLLNIYSEYKGTMPIDAIADLEDYEIEY